MKSYSSIGDGFLNSCQRVDSKYFEIFKRVFFPIFGSSYLVFLDLVLHLCISTVFSISKAEMQPKQARIYVLTRLFLFIVLERLIFAETLFSPLSVIFPQRSPCSSKMLYGALRLPSPDVAAPSMLLFFISELPLFKHFYTSLLFQLFIFAFPLFDVFTGDSSFLQAYASLFLSYIFHFILIHMRFKIIHIINGILFAASASMSIYFFVKEPSYVMTSQSMAFGCLTICIYEFLFFRFGLSKRGFGSIQSPSDFLVECGAMMESYSRQVEESQAADFEIILNTDIRDSIISLIIYIVMFSAIGMVGSYDDE